MDIYNNFKKNFMKMSIGEILDFIISITIAFSENQVQCFIFVVCFLAVKIIAVKIGRIDIV